MVNIKLLDSICKTEIQLYDLYQELIALKKTGKRNFNAHKKEIITQIKSVIATEEELFTPFRNNPALAKETYLYLKKAAKEDVTDEIQILFSENSDTYIISRIFYILKFFYLLDTGYFKAWIDPDFINLVSGDDIENGIKYLKHEIPFLELSFAKSLYYLIGFYGSDKDTIDNLIIAYLNPSLESELLENDFNDLPLALRADLIINNHVPKNIKQAFYNQYFGDKVDNILDYMITNDENSVMAVLYFKAALLYQDPVGLRDIRDSIPTMFKGNDILINDLLEFIDDNAQEKKRLNADYKVSLANIKEYNLCEEDLEIYGDILNVTKQIARIYKKLADLEKQGLKNSVKFEKLLNALKELLEEENAYYEYFRCNTETAYYLAVFLSDNSEYELETAFTAIIDYNDDEDAFTLYRIINKLFNISYEDESIFYDTLYEETRNAVKKDNLSKESVRDIIVNYDESIYFWILKFLSEEVDEDIDTTRMRYSLAFMSIDLERCMINNSFGWESIRKNFSEVTKRPLKQDESSENVRNVFGQTIIMAATEELMNYINLEDIKNKNDIALLLAVLKAGLLYIPLDKIENIKMQVQKLLDSYNSECEEYDNADDDDEIKMVIGDVLDSAYGNYARMNEDCKGNNLLL